MTILLQHHEGADSLVQNTSGRTSSFDWYQYDSTLAHNLTCKKKKGLIIPLRAFLDMTEIY